MLSINWSAVVALRFIITFLFKTHNSQPTYKCRRGMDSGHRDGGKWGMLRKFRVKGGMEYFAYLVQNNKSCICKNNIIEQIIAYLPKTFNSPS